jgi:hypothetical protein
MASRLLPVVGFSVGILAGGLAQPALADEIFDGIAGLPGSVEDVRIGGTWEEDGKIGTYRILVTRTGGEAVTARMFVQWVAYTDDGGATVEHTIEVEELAALNVDVIDFTSDSDADGLSVFVQTLDPNGTVDTDYVLYVFSRNEHRFGPASN